MRKRGFTDSFNYAIEGLKHTWRTQRNMRIHFIVGAIVISLGIVLNVDRVDFILLLSAVVLVIVTEMLNTAIELAVDIFTKEFHHMAKMAKDIAAGCVFIAAAYSIIVGYLVFFRNSELINLSEGFLKIRQSPWHLTFIVSALIFSVVIALKALFRKGTPLRGGMPSGHSALGFSIFTITAFLSKNTLITVLVLIMAILLAASRIKKELHTVWEVFAGSIIGFLITVLVFQLLYQRTF
ncbi:MAG: diacylglycerol kinase [Candidatus Omnitrophota bacterium]